MGVVTGEKPGGSIHGSESNNNAIDLELNCAECAQPQVPAGTTERKVMTKIDMRVIPVLCVMYLLAFLDRVNISNARIFRLEEDLGLIKDSNDKNSTKFNTALVIFFVPYCLFEIPSNILLKKFKPHVWLSLNMFLFGFTTIMHGLVKNYSGLLAARFFLGVFETGMFPGAFYLIGMWYKRSEAQKRYSFFFNSTTLAGAFGGLLAAAIGKMDGLNGFFAWRWIFIIEGALTVLISFLFYFIIPDFPEEAKWLSDEERKFVQMRLRVDQGSAGAQRPIKFSDVLSTLKDYKVIAGGFAYFGLIVPAYSYAYFAPGIIRGFNYGSIETQLRSVPPWAVAFGFSMMVATVSDYLRHRFLLVIITVLIAIAGFSIELGVQDNRNIQYAGLFLIVIGTFTAMPTLICWFNMNLGGHHRRSIGSAWQIGFGNLGGIIAVYIFVSKDAPRYLSGYSICLGWCVLSMIGATIYGLACYRANKKRDGLPSDVAESMTLEQKEDLGDMAPDYRYLL